VGDLLNLKFKYHRLNSDLEKELIRKLEQSLGLVFLEEPPGGNLCYSHSNNDLRDEFREFFSAMDFQHFLKSFEGRVVEVPEDRSDFWRAVAEGRKLSKN